MSKEIAGKKVIIEEYNCLFWGFCLNSSSNCVINLSPDKPSVFKEAFRVLKVL